MKYSEDSGAESSLESGNRRGFSGSGQGSLVPVDRAGRPCDRRGRFSSHARAVV